MVPMQPAVRSKSPGEGGGGRGGYPSEFLVGVCRPVLQIQTLFQTKVFHFWPGRPVPDFPTGFVVAKLSLASVLKSRIGKIRLECYILVTCLKSDIPIVAPT